MSTKRSLTYLAGSQVESLRELGLLNLAREWMKFVFDDPLGEGVSHGYVKKIYENGVRYFGIRDDGNNNSNDRRIHSFRPPRKGEKKGARVMKKDASKKKKKKCSKVDDG